MRAQQATYQTSHLSHFALAIEALKAWGAIRSFNDEVSTKARRTLLKKKIFTNRSVVAMYAIGSLTATASTCGCKALELAA